MSARKHCRPGYTLLEILIVLVLVAVIGRIAIPRVSLSRFRADGAMRVAQAVLQQAERNAVQRQTDVMVSFDTVGGRVRMVYDVNNNHLVDAGEEVHWKSLEEGNRFAVPRIGVNGAVAKSIVGNNIATSADGYPTVYYHRDGASSSGIEAYLRSSTAADSNGFRALVVTQATGRVDLYRSGDGQWRKVGF